MMQAAIGQKFALGIQVSQRQDPMASKPVLQGKPGLLSRH